MPGSVERKVGVSGDHGTRFVTLPKAWCDAMDLGPGTPVRLLFENVAVIVPPGREAEGRRVLALLKEGAK
jgi:hypothetical protein